MLEYPISYNLSLDTLSLSLPAYHDAKDPVSAPGPVSPPSEPAASDADSSPSALSAYSPYALSHDHRRSGSFESSVSPPASAPSLDGLHHPRVPVEDAHFAFSPPPSNTHYIYNDRRQSLPNVRYRHSYNSLPSYHPPLSTSLPSSNAFPQEQPVHTQYSPRPASSYDYSTEGGQWDAPQHHHQQPQHAEDSGPFTTAPVNTVAHGLAITATSAALASTDMALAPGLAKVHEQQPPYFDDGGPWLEQGEARPNTAGSASGSFAGHGYEHTPEPPAVGKPQEVGGAAQQQQGQDSKQQGEGAEAKPGHKGKSNKTYSFVALPGNAVKKRPRRRYDEIERLYRCR